MRSSVIGGHVQMAFDAVTTMTENVKAGQVRALGTSAAKRSSVLPDVPTIAEAGVPGYEATIWLGVMAPANTPKAIVDKLNAETAKALANPAVREKLTKMGSDPMPMSVAQFGDFVGKEIALNAALVKAAGVQITK
jgi:tripartite-type tricarboxylate transporter receptor subunit TctC